jgi:hypothetical protein
MDDPDPSNWLEYVVRGVAVLLALGLVAVLAVIITYIS